MSHPLIYVNRDTTIGIIPFPSDKRDDSLFLYWVAPNCTCEGLWHVYKSAEGIVHVEGQDHRFLSPAAALAFACMYIDDVKDALNGKLQEVWTRNFVSQGRTL